MVEGTKRVVYLFGAGATQAELDYKGIQSNQLISEVTKRVIEKIKDDEKLKVLLRDFTTTDRIQNIEHIISMLESIGIRKYTDIAENLRTLFKQDIENCTMIDGKTIDPFLTKALLELQEARKMHELENLNGIITTNYDSLLDRAFNDIYKKVNYGFRHKSTVYSGEDNSNKFLVKLHGSFNWKFGMPIEVLSDLESVKEPKETIWIPPGIDKKAEIYPFNIIWGKAYDILDCDILRVVGSSLSPNDWGLLSLIFKSQINRDYSVEIINQHHTGEHIRKNYGFIKNVKSFGNLDNCGSILSRISGEVEDTFRLENPLKFWIKENGYDLSKKYDISIYPHLSEVIGD